MVQRAATSRREFLAASAATLLGPRLLFAQAAPMDAAYLNGRIWTGVASAPLASAMGTAGSTIVSLDEHEVRQRIDKRTRVIDLEGAFVTPGFIDSHTHFLQAAATLAPPDLRKASSRQEFARRIGEAARAAKPGEWIRGGYWDAELWGGELPTRQWIDSVTPDTPVAVARLDLHMLLLNSLALRLAGIDRHTPEPQGGRIVRDAAGEPTGIVVDLAKPLVERVIPAPTEAAVEKTLREGAAFGLRYGVTQTHAIGLDWVMHDALVRWRAKGETGMRFYSFVPLQDWEKLDAIVRREGRGDDWLRWGGLKALADGSLGSRTALFHRPYDDAPGVRGLSINDLAQLREWTTEADLRGLQVTLHAIGDEANDDVLDLFAAVAAKNGVRDRRFRIEHAQHLSPAAIGRFAKQNVIASVQPYHAIDDGRWAIQRIGAERLKGTYAFRSLLDAGARVCFGSDWPVAPFNPMTGVAAAVLRQTIDGANPDGWMPEQKVTVEQALTAYTTTGAYAGFQEDRLGSLKKGYLADFVVLDADPFRIDPQRLNAVKVLRTVVNGREQYVA